MKWCGVYSIWGVITAKIKFGILLCCLSMRFFMFSMVFLMLRIILTCSRWCSPKRRCCFVGSVWCYAKPRCYYSCPYCVMRNLDAIIETSMLLVVSVWCYAKPRCYYSCPYGVMRNLDAIIETSMLLFVSVWCYAKPRCYYSCFELCSS